MSLQELLPQFCAWADAVLAAKPPYGIAAFNFNIYEGSESHHVEIVGYPTYDPSDSDWACDDIFGSGKPRFELRHGIVGQGWEQALEVAKQFLQTYLATGSGWARRAQESLAVSIGFVDGDLHLVWSQNKA